MVHFMFELIDTIWIEQRRSNPIIRTSESTLMNRLVVVEYEANYRLSVKEVTFTIYLDVWIAQTIIKEQHTIREKGCLCHTHRLKLSLILIPKGTANLYVERFSESAKRLNLIL